MKSITRRDFLKLGGLAFFGTAGGALLAQQKVQSPSKTGHGIHQSGVDAIQMQGHNSGLVPDMVGEVDHEKNGFNPTEVLTVRECWPGSARLGWSPPEGRWLT